MIHDRLRATGHFSFRCFDCWGRLRWRREFDNVVVTVGKNFALDTYLAGAAYTVTGPFMGLISNAGFTVGPVAADTMTSHAGWAEAGGANAPTYTAPRPTVTWGAAIGGTKSADPVIFNITGAGTIEGGFIVFGPGALATIDNTGGTLYSAGLFVGGAALVGSGDTVNVLYSTSL